MPYMYMVATTVQIAQLQQRDRTTLAQLRAVLTNAIIYRFAILS